MTIWFKYADGSTSKPIDISENAKTKTFKDRVDTIFEGKDELYQELVETLEGVKRIGKEQGATHLFNTVCYHVLHHNTGAAREILREYKRMVMWYDNNSAN